MSESQKGQYRVMDAAEITAICTGIPAIIGAITALIVAIKANSKANAAQASKPVTPVVPSTVIDVDKLN
jgi:hypothetical protein